MRIVCPGIDALSVGDRALAAGDVPKVSKMSRDNSGVVSENSFFMMSFTCLIISFTQIASQTMSGFPVGNFTFSSD